MPELKKRLGFFMVLALAITSIFGSGLFFGISKGASLAGNMVLLSWIILSILSIYIAGCFAELSSMFPSLGGTYEYAKQAYGRFFSFLVGWLTWLVNNIGVVVLVVAAVEYLMPGPSLMPVKMGISLFFIIIFNVITYVGIEASSAVITAFAGIMIFSVIAIIVRGLSFAKVSNIIPLSPNPLIGGLGVFAAIFFMAETFFGWEAVTFLSEETKDPQKNIPKALIWGTVIIALLGLALYAVMLGVVPWNELAGTNAPLAAVAAKIFGPRGLDIISICVYMTLLGSAASGIIAMPRLLVALARDKLFLSQFANIHPKFNTPSKAVVFQTIITVAILFIGFANYTKLLGLLVPMALLLYIFTVLSVPILRHKKPLEPRPFKLFAGRVGPIVIALFMLGIICSWLYTTEGAANTFFLSLSLVFAGIPLYLMVEFYYNPDTITKMNDRLSYITLATERISLPKWVRQSILDFLGDVKGMTILDFGCSVGTLTLPLLLAVGGQGKVISTNFSKNDLTITRRRADRSRWSTNDFSYGELKVIHDPEHMRRVHPDIRFANAAISVGILGYLQDVKKVLSDVRRVLPPGGKICFVDYTDYFHIIPNVEWLAKNKIIEQTFRECGFSVQVTRKKGLLWNYVFVHGIRSGIDVAYI